MPREVAQKQVRGTVIDAAEGERHGVAGSDYASGYDEGASVGDCIDNAGEAWFDRKEYLSCRDHAALPQPAGTYF